MMDGKDNIKVSVIVPVYKAEMYIEKCTTYLFGQSLDCIEYIFVDDGGGDRSIEIVKEKAKVYAIREDKLKIVYHEKNMGSMAARLSGLEAATGEYTIFCDSDDWPEVNMYKTMYNLAKEHNIDMLYCNFTEEYTHGPKYMKEKSCDNPQEMIRQIIEKNIHGALWNKLVKTKLYKRLDSDILKGINIWEDMYMTVMVLLEAPKISFLNKYLYHYNQQNTSSLLHGITEKKMQDKIMVCNQLELVFKERGLSQKYDKALKHRKLWAKMEYATDREIRNFDKWRSLWPEAVKETGSSNFSVFNKILFKLLAEKHDTTAKIMLAIKDRLKKNI